jgi:hypothetical protein
MPGDNAELILVLSRSLFLNGDGRVKTLAKSKFWALKLMAILSCWDYLQNFL